MSINPRTDSRKTVPQTPKCWGFKSMLLTAAVAATCVATAWSARPKAQPAPLEPARREAASILRKALDQAGAGDADLEERFVDAATQAAERLEADSVIAADLFAQAKRLKEPGSDSAAVRQALEKAHDTLCFQPLMEAELPRGFPLPGPLGEIRVKQYPAYRMAVSKAGKGDFWTLFAHITRNNIAMTAPVEMNYGDPKSAATDEESMAFLYAEPELGRPGVEGNVQVVDAEPLTVVSLGLSGQRTETMVDQARSRLARWLTGQRQYEAAGDLRVLGYNSPFVPRDRQFWEVQIPIRPVEQGVPSAGDSY